MILTFFRNLFRKPRLTKAELLAQREQEKNNLHLKPESISSGPFAAWAMENINRISSARKKIDHIDQELLVMDAKEIINPTTNG